MYSLQNAHLSESGSFPLPSVAALRVATRTRADPVSPSPLLQLAKSVNAVLTVCYRDIYSSGPEDNVGKLQLLTSPLAATEEVLNLFAGGLVPVEIAMPAVLHAIGSTKEDIDKAVEDAKKRQQEKQDCERCEQQYTMADHQMDLEERKVALKKTEATRTPDSAPGR